MSRTMRLLGIPAAAIGLTLFFIFLGFPWELLGQRAVALAETATGYSIDFDELDPYLSFAGPGFQATELAVVSPEGQEIALDRLRVRPAWSFAWFRGDPAIYFDVETGWGLAEGALVIGERPAWDGVFRGITLSELPEDWLPEGFDLTGVIDAQADLEVIDMARLEGEFSLQAKEGSVDIEQLPLPLRYDTLDADIVFGGEHFAHIQKFEMKGPMISASVAGHIGKADQLGNEPLDLDAEVKVENPLLLALLQNAGVALDRSGKAAVAVGGTLRKPKVER